MAGDRYRLDDLWDVSGKTRACGCSVVGCLTAAWLPTPHATHVDAPPAAAAAARYALEELAEQNRQLIAALEEVQRQRDELLPAQRRAGGDQPGRLALYTELSEELEATNRGVVALYAELDEQYRAAARGQRGEDAVPGQRQPRAARPGHLDHRAGPAAARPGVRPADRRAAPPARSIRGRADGPARPGQRAARPGQGRVRPARAGLGDGRPARLFGQLRGHRCGRWPRPEVRAGHRASPTAPPLRTDPVMLTQVLRNLLTNALKFTDRRRGAPDAREPVDDRVGSRGRATPASASPPRARAGLRGVLPGARCSRRSGTGLGLPYARRLVPARRHLALTSAPGEGSTFTVDLPVAGV